MLKKHSGIILVLIFSMVIIIFSNLQNIISGDNCDQISSGDNLTEGALNLLLINASRQRILLRDLLSCREYTWVYVFSPQCPACKIVSDNIREEISDRLIGLALAEQPIPSIHKMDIHHGISIYYVKPSQAISMGICSVPYLTKISRQGKILDAISSYKPVLNKIREL